MLKPETYYARNILSVMPEQYKVHRDDSIYTKIQTVTDYVSGMTDSYALKVMKKNYPRQVTGYKLGGYKFSTRQDKKRASLD